MKSPIRKWEPRIARKYRPESRTIAFKTAGQVDLLPHVEYEYRIRISNNKVSVVRRLSRRARGKLRGRRSSLTVGQGEESVRRAENESELRIQEAGLGGSEEKNDHRCSLGQFSCIGHREKPSYGRFWPRPSTPPPEPHEGWTEGRTQRVLCVFFPSKHTTFPRSLHGCWGNHMG